MTLDVDRASRTLKSCILGSRRAVAAPQAPTMDSQQYPFANVFKIVKIDEWVRAEKSGSVEKLLVRGATVNLSRAVQLDAAHHLPCLVPCVSCMCRIV